MKKLKIDKNMVRMFVPIVILVAFVGVLYSVSILINHAMLQGSYVVRNSDLAFTASLFNDDVWRCYNADGDISCEDTGYSLIVSEHSHVIGEVLISKFNEPIADNAWTIETLP